MIRAVPAQTSIVIAMYPGMDALDLIGPYEILARIPNSTVHLAAATPMPVRTSLGAAIVPDTLFSTKCARDVLFVPGGPGHRAMMEDAGFLAFLFSGASGTKLISSVCTGSLLLCAAGLLDGYRATTHWLCLDQLSAYGAIPVTERVVVDRNRITGAGVSAGIDLALKMVALLCSTRIARQIQLLLEYDPDPPFHGGSPRTADTDIVAELRARYAREVEAGYGSSAEAD